MNIHVIGNNITGLQKMVDYLKHDSRYDVCTFASGHDYLAYLGGIEKVLNNPGVIIISLPIKKILSHDFITRILKHTPLTEIALYSDENDTETAFELFRQGVNNFISIDESSIERLTKWVENSYESWQSRQKLQITHGTDAASPVLAGKSNKVASIINLVEKAAQHPSHNVSIQGQTGAGKSTIAAIIHHNSPLKEHPFVVVNLEALSPQQQDIELFGTEREGVSYSVGFRQGAIERSSGGTLFIEEISLLENDVQQKLLEVIRSGEFKRIKGNIAIPFNSRIIISSAAPLQRCIEEGALNAELYYLLRGIPIEVPSLCNRREDISAIANLLLERLNRTDESDVKMLTPAAMAKLTHYNYPGNIPELRAVIELGCILTPDNEILPEHIIFSSVTYEETILPDEPIMTLKQHTDKIIKSCLEKHDNNVLKVAEILNIGKSTIYNMLKKNG